MTRLQLALVIARKVSPSQLLGELSIHQVPNLLRKRLMLFGEVPRDQGVQEFTSSASFFLTSPVIAQEPMSLQIVILDGVTQMLHERSARGIMYEVVLRSDLPFRMASSLVATRVGTHETYIFAHDLKQ